MADEVLFDSGGKMDTNVLKYYSEGFHTLKTYNEANSENNYWSKVHIFLTNFFECKDIVLPYPYKANYTSCPTSF